MYYFQKKEKKKKEKYVQYNYFVKDKSKISKNI